MTEVIAQSIEAANGVHLRYVSDSATPGITRIRRGKSFAYLMPQGKPVRDEATLARIRSLAIPPTWTKVWICPSANGHLQAVGRDARGRKQYRYHPRYRETRDQAKFAKMIEFAQALPRIHRRTRRDLARKGLPREKVLAAVLCVMEKTLIRVGNEEYAHQNHSYGLTTLEDKHAKFRRGKVTFEFRGKAGKEHHIDLDDPRLARIVKQCQDLPGEQLFQYVDESGSVVDIDSADVNAYLQLIAGDQFTAKDFRTWAGTVLAARALRAVEEIDSKAARKRNVLRAVEAVAKRLGNTRTVCRKCYIHPAIIDAYLDGSLTQPLAQVVRKEAAQSAHSLAAEEAAVLSLLQQKLVAGARHESGARRRSAA